MELLVGHNNFGGTPWLMQKAIDNAVSIPNSMNIIVGDHPLKIQYILPNDFKMALKKNPDVKVAETANGLEFENGSKIKFSLLTIAESIASNENRNFMFIDDFMDFQWIESIIAVDASLFEDLYGCQSQSVLDNRFSYKCDFKDFADGIGGKLTTDILFDIGHGVCSLAMSKKEPLTLTNDEDSKRICKGCNNKKCVRYGKTLIVSDSCPMYLEHCLKTWNSDLKST